MRDFPDEQISLRQIHLHLSGGCGLSCRCSRVETALGESGTHANFLPLSTALQAIRQALPVGLRSVHINGSDTLFHPELNPLLDRLESLELAVQVETSGVGLTPPRASRLARLPQSRACIALDGADAATHDSYASRAGAFDYATRAVRILSGEGMAVQVIFSVRRRNVLQIPQLVKLVEELGGESIRFVLPYPVPSQPMKSNGNGHHPNGGSKSNGSKPISAATLEVEELIALSWRVERDLAYDTPIHLMFEQPPAFRGLHPKARVDGQERCGALNSLSVTPDGEYVLCSLGQALPGMTLGKVGESTLAELWTSHPTLQMLREGLPDRLQGVCERCTLKESCLGECVVENKLRTGSFWSPGWFCEAAERVGLFPAGRLIENTW